MNLPKSPPGGVSRPARARACPYPLISGPSTPRAIRFRWEVERIACFGSLCVQGVRVCGVVTTRLHSAEWGITGATAVYCVRREMSMRQTKVPKKCGGSLPNEEKTGEACGREGKQSRRKEGARQKFSCGGKVHNTMHRIYPFCKHPIRATVVISRISPSVAAAGAVEEREESNSELCMLCVLRCANVCVLARVFIRYGASCVCNHYIYPATY